MSECPRCEWCRKVDGKCEVRLFRNGGWYPLEPQPECTHCHCGKPALQGNLFEETNDVQ